ncbi:unnamed protein product [Oppiella nova]|uniref:Gamma-glutamylcyclotransferase family protein n=1 Tax=Oppiella nova TaxID=334625 RepID=A0A7R9QI59_9ACAR|nr:unnamed protein product [Oppiella nova]CAG2165494.1 unnamed protein product [Oppiella nova]
MITKPDRYLMFVYGTIKTGQPNHYILKDPDNGEAEFICGAESIDKWPLVIGSKYNVPYLLHKRHFGKRIYGELWSVDINMQNKMDDFEAHPRFYRRMEIPVLTDDNTPVKAWAYFLIDYKPHLLDLDTYENYNTYGDHGLRYVEGCERHDHPKAPVSQIACKT